MNNKYAPHPMCKACKGTGRTSYGQNTESASCMCMTNEFVRRRLDEEYERPEKVKPQFMIEARKILETPFTDEEMTKVRKKAVHGIGINRPYLISTEWYRLWVTIDKMQTRIDNLEFENEQLEESLKDFTQ